MKSAKFQAQELTSVVRRQRKLMFIAALGLIQLLRVSRERPLLEFFISKVLSPEKNQISGESCKWALDTFTMFSRRSCRRLICSSFAAEDI